MLGIVERILAALIILALLTLLIILAFPVPPRPQVGAPPGDPNKPADQKAEAPPAPAPAPAPTTPAPTTPAPTSAPSPAPVAAPAPQPTNGAGETTAPKPAPATQPTDPAPGPKRFTDKLPETRPQAPPPPPKPVVIVTPKSDREKVTRTTRYHAARVRREPQRTGRGDRLVSRNYVGPDCCCDVRDRPYWAKGPRTYLVERSEPPYWAEPRRERWAQAPVGTCPE